MGQIWVMTESLANQIAAGEVVERPASCLKELLENSLDAGATEIDVAIEEGGIASILVQDNGSGMAEEDALLAFARHATSKIHHAHDLFRVSTLGFRGEALASIAAVAKVDMNTRTRTAEHGIRVQGQGGELSLVVEPAGTPSGTRIQVKDLFFNTPARLKYLRSVTTEQARCLEVVQRAALSRPDVGFRMHVNDHVVFQTTGAGKPLEVLATLYGIGEARQFIELRAESADYEVHGYIGRPTQGRASRQHGHLFINSRPVRNLALHQAVVAGYQGRLMINRHPMYALYVRMDPTLVDVNIHPHKAEVRFSEERDVARLLQQGVTSALEEAFLVPKIQLGARKEPKLEGEQGRLFSAPNLDFTHNSTRVLETQSRNDAAVKPTGGDKPRPNHTPIGQQQPDREVGADGYRHNRSPAWSGRPSVKSDQAQPSVRETRAFLDTALATGPVEIAATAAQVEGTTVHESSQGHDAAKANLSQLRLIGQALGVYILADDGESLYVIDQHAAHERVLYERFTERMESIQVHTIALLAPISLTLSPTERAVLDSVRRELQALGLEFEDFGGQDVVLRTIPDIWEGLDAAALVEEMIHGLDHPSGHPDVRAKLREVVVLRACKAAIKANHRLSMMEMEALCQALPDLQDPFHCPHGRPIFIRLTNRDLEKEFRRIV